MKIKKNKLNPKMLSLYLGRLSGIEFEEKKGQIKLMLYFFYFHSL